MWPFDKKPKVITCAYKVVKKSIPLKVLQRSVILHMRSGRKLLITIQSVVHHYYSFYSLVNGEEANIWDNWIKVKRLDKYPPVMMFQELPDLASKSNFYTYKNNGEQQINMECVEQIEYSPIEETDEVLNVQYEVLEKI